MDCREGIKLLIDHSLSGQRGGNANKHCVALLPCSCTGCAGTPDPLILGLSGLLLSLKPSGHGLETLPLANHVTGEVLTPLSIGALLLKMGVVTPPPLNTRWETATPARGGAQPKALTSLCF